MDLLEKPNDLEIITGDQDQHIINFKTIASSAQLANINIAKRHRELSSIRNEEEGYDNYPLCNTSQEILGKYGIGLQCYFLFIKQLGYLFILLAICSIWPMYQNYQGRGYESIYQSQGYTYFSLANQAGTSIGETDINRAELNIPITHENLEKLWPIDLLTSVLFTIFIIWYWRVSKNAIGKSTDENFTIANFSVQVENLPPYINKEQVEEIFNIYGEIKEIYLARKYEGKLANYKQIFEAVYAIGINIKLQNPSQDISVLSKLNNKKLIKTSHEELQVVCAFVVFTTIQAKKDCLEHYKSRRGRICCKKNLKTVRRQSHFRLNVKEADIPSEIIWTNLEYHYLSVIKSRIQIILLICIIILISFVMIYGIKAYFYSSAGSVGSCIGQSVDGNLPLSDAKLFYSQLNQRNCYCRQQKLDELMSSKDMISFCQVYIDSFTTSTFINLSVSICIVSVNFILKIMIRYCHKYAKFTTKTKERQNILTLVFVAVFINTALTTFLANTKFSNVYIGISELSGKYNDISRDWYNDVGNTITVTMIVSIFSPHIFNLLIVYPFGSLIRRCFSKYYKSQKKLNKFYQGATFDISNGLSQVLAVVFTSYMYSSGIPLLNILCLITLFFTYWCEKFLILRHYKKPPQYSDTINARAIMFLPFAIIFHCTFAIYAYGSSEIFPIGYTKDMGSSFVIPNTSTTFQRLSKDYGIANLIMIILNIFIFIGIRYFSRIYNKINTITRVQTELQLSVEQDIETLLNENKISGLTTYDIYQNPKYRDLILSIDSISKLTKTQPQLFENKEILMQFYSNTETRRQSDLNPLEEIKIC